MEHPIHTPVAAKRGIPLFRVRLLPGYVFQEFSKTFLVAFLAVIIVLFVVMGYKQVSVQKGLDFVSVFSLFPFLMAKAMPYALPFGTVCACALAYGRLSGDNEISAMRTSGVHLHHIITPVLAFSLLASVVTYAVDDLLSPVLRNQSERVQDRVLRNLVQQFSSMGSPTYSWQISDTKKIYLYVDRIKGDELQGVAVFMAEDNQIDQTIIAQSARLKYDVVKDEGEQQNRKRLTIILKAGTVKQINPDRPARINIVPAQIGGDRETLLPYFFGSSGDAGDYGDPSYNNTAENQALARHLREKIAEANGKIASGQLSPKETRAVKDGIGNFTKSLNDVRLEIYGRLALATSCFFLALVTVPLSIIIKRGHVIVAFLIGLSLVVVYMVAFLMGSKFLGMGGYVHPAVAVWLPNLLLFAGGGWLMWVVFRE
jgi:lipopolysaccharide export system permease protein